MRLVRLTHYESHEAVYVNPEHVIVVERSGSHTAVVFTSGGVARVTEGTSQVAQLLTQERT